VVFDAGDREIEQLTNLTELGFTAIAAIYKDRCEVVLFFKALKQHLKVRTVGTSENALHLQIWTALIAIPLLKRMSRLSRAKCSRCRTWPPCATEPV
jgi:IS4 transposase